MPEYVYQIHKRIADIRPAAWNALCNDDNPFVSWDFLDALEQNNCIRADYGWQPMHLAIYQIQPESSEQALTLVAAMPGYLKTNSHGEFVFDWAWAHAYQQHGQAYYPKLLIASPYSPVTAGKLLAPTRELKQELITFLTNTLSKLKLSSAHVNFLTSTDAECFAQAPWLARFDWQFHWHHRGWPDFASFLASLDRKKRKNILQERAKVRAAGVNITLKNGAEIGDALWQQIHALYVSTFDYKGNTPVLTAEFFIDYARRAPQQIIVVLAYQDDQLVAMALLLRSATTLYGRYWGAHTEIPGLHFECCYYQGIEYCLREGLQCFEPGAQGEHKLARGFLPNKVRSAHLIADARFRTAIGRAIDAESRSLLHYYHELMQHQPYKT